MENREFIEIPFGAKDSDLYQFEYTIPNGYEAEIKDGKVIIRKVESEDEKIRKQLICLYKKEYGENSSARFAGIKVKDIIAWLEKQKPVEPFEIEHGKYYYCIQDYYGGGNKRAAKGDVVLALRGMHMMALHAKACEYFLPVNNMEPNPVEWTAEDDNMLDETLHFINEFQRSNMCKDEGDMQNSVTCERWLESLRPEPEEAL